MKSKYQRIEEDFFGKESATPIVVTSVPFEEDLTVFPLGAVESGVDFEERGFELFPSIWPPPNTLFIEWTYTIDLDRELFSVDHEIHFPLSAIPDTWIRELNLIRGGDSEDDDDDNDGVVIIPQAIDISYPKLAVDETYVELYKKANCSILQIEVSDTRFSLNSVYEGLCFELTKAFIDSTFKGSYFSKSTFFSWGPEDVPFKQLAFAFLLLADRYSFSLSPFSSSGENDGGTAEKNDNEIGVACPTSSSFWFAGIFVYLTTHLKDDGVRKSAIGHVLELTKNCQRRSFTAFLFSICEIVVIDISEEGVKHTEALPFCDIIVNVSPVIHNVGLPVMISYFTQSRRSLAKDRIRTPSSPSSLPYDILLNIVEYADWKTTISLSATSKLLRECVERLGPKLGNFRLLKYDVDLKNFLACRDGDDLVKVEINRLPENHHYRAKVRSESDLFNIKIRYPGVRQRAFIPMIHVTELNSLQS